MNNLMLLPKSIQGFCFCTSIFSCNEMNSTMHFLSMSLHLCPILSFFISYINSLPILYLFPLTCRYPNNEHENDSTNGQRVVYAGELGNEEDMEDDDLPQDLLRLIEQDERQILPHQEIIEVVNLGTEEEKKSKDRDHVVVYY